MKPVVVRTRKSKMAALEVCIYTMEGRVGVGRGDLTTHPQCLNLRELLPEQRLWGLCFY
jgi:hypothetical protein